MRSFARRFVVVICVGTLLSVTAGHGVSVAFAANLAHGKKIYKAKCRKCHGKEGKGDGPKAKSLKKKPRDYTDKAKMSEFTDADLIKVVKEGKKPMPKFGKKLNDKDIEDVIAYIRTFAGPIAAK